MPEESLLASETVENAETNTTVPETLPGAENEKVIEAMKKAVPGFFSPAPEEGSSEQSSEQVPDKSVETSPDPLKSDGQSEDSTPPKPETETPKPEEKPTQTTIDLPEAHIRALTHSGWEPKDIEEMQKVDTELLKKTAERAYESDQRATLQYQRAGTELLGGASPAAPEQKVDPVVDVSAIAKQYTNESGEIASDVQPLLDAISTLQGKVGELSSNQASVSQQINAQQQADQAAATQELEQELNTFMGSTVSADEEYEKFYGKTWDAATPPQMQNRLAVSKQAGIISAGAYAYGEDMSYTDALRRAHSQLVAPVVERKIIGNIKKTLTKRQSNMAVDIVSAQKKEEPAKGGNTIDDTFRAVAKKMEEIGFV